MIMKNIIALSCCLIVIISFAYKNITVNDEELVVKDAAMPFVTKDAKGKWIKNGKVNDVDDVAKEGFLSVSSYEDSLYAIWLDLRDNSRNKIVGALSADGGKTWSKNKIYIKPQKV